ncbi:hypothetical protein MDA_GLEAN10017283 [Myotis davidii]|uniref:Uncharacterized protein n=1 Tax=Myotis davidii TaxID=225400 RepID=L5MJ32_MYODS|nr:hypothetical protein MDA_GLEAN10017283 [Myotis davidii]
MASLKTALSPSPRLARHFIRDLHPEGDVASLKTAIRPSPRLARHFIRDLHPEGDVLPPGGPLTRGLDLSWQSDIPLAAWEPSGDVHLLAGSKPKLQTDIFSAAEEAGEAPTTTAVLAAISLACG